MALCSFFSFQVKVSFDLDNIQIKYIDEDNDEVKYLLPHPGNKSPEEWLVAEMTFCLVMICPSGESVMQIRVGECFPI